MGALRRSRMWRLVLATVLSTSMVFAMWGNAGAWTTTYWLNGNGACGANTWCVAWFYVDGGSDQWDWVSIDYYKECYGTRIKLNWSGTVYRGDNARSFWNQEGCHSIEAYIYVYDYLAPTPFLGPYS